MFDGQRISGLSTSLTVIVNEHSSILFTWSVNMYCTVVEPMGNTLDGTRPSVGDDEYIRVTLLTASVAFGGVHVATLPLCIGCDVRVCEDGHGESYTGGKLSVMVIWKEHEAVFPAVSVTRYVT